MQTQDQITPHDMFAAFAMHALIVQGSITPEMIAHNAGLYADEMMLDRAKAPRTFCPSASNNHLVAGQPLQTADVGEPIDPPGRWDAAIVVQVYALGAGVTIEGELGDLPGREGSFELKANGKRFLFEPIAAQHAEWPITSIEGHVSPVRQALQAEDQKAFPHAEDASGHYEPSFKTVILSLPHGMGKTTLAPELARQLGCIAIVDEWMPSSGLLHGALHLTVVPFADFPQWDGIPRFDEDLSPFTPNPS